MKLSQDRATELIRRLKQLKNDSKKQRRKKDYLDIPEPKAYEMLFREIKPIEGVLEVGRCSNSCQQVVDAWGIEHYASVPRDIRVNKDLITDWDYDIIINPVSKSVALDYIAHYYKLLKPGRRMAILCDLGLMESERRLPFFRKQPFNKLYVISKRVAISRDGKFSHEFKHGYTSTCFGNSSWFVWEKTDRPYKPIVAWLTDQCDDLLEKDQEGFYVGYKKTFEITLD